MIYLHRHIIKLNITRLFIDVTPPSRKARKRRTVVMVTSSNRKAQLSSDLCAYKKLSNVSRTFFCYIIDRIVYYFSITDNETKPVRVMFTWFIHIAVNTPFWLCKYTLKWPSLSWWGTVWFSSQRSQQKVVTCCCPHLKSSALSSVSYSSCTQTQVFPKPLCLYKCPTMGCWQARLFCWTQIMCDSLTLQGSSNSPVLQDELSQIILFIMIIVNENKTDLNLLYHSSQE